MRSRACTAVVGSLIAGESPRMAMSTSIRSAKAGSWSTVRWRASTKTRRASVRSGSVRAPVIRSTTRPGARYSPTAGTTVTKPPVWSARRSSAARSTAAMTAGGPGCVISVALTSSSGGSGGVDVRGVARVDVVDHRVAAPHQRAQDAPDLRALERPLHERHERAERDQREQQPAQHGDGGQEVAARLARLAADRREREQRVDRGRGRQREPGDDDRVAPQPRGEPRGVRRRLDLGGDEHGREHDPGEGDHPAGERSEDRLRPRQSSAAAHARRRVARRRAEGRWRARRRPRWPPAPAPTSPTRAGSGVGRAGRRRGPDGGPPAGSRRDRHLLGRCAPLPPRPCACAGHAAGRRASTARPRRPAPRPSTTACDRHGPPRS